MIKKTSNSKWSQVSILKWVTVVLILAVLFFIKVTANLENQVTKLKKQTTKVRNKLEALRPHLPYTNEILRNSNSLTAPFCALKARDCSGSDYLLVIEYSSLVAITEPHSKHLNLNIAYLYWAMKLEQSIEDNLLFTLSGDNFSTFSFGLVPWSDYQAFVKQSAKLSLADFLNKYFVDKGSYWQMKEELMERSDTRPRRDLMIIGYLSRHFHLVVYRADYSGRYFVRKNESNNSGATHPKASANKKHRR